MARTEKLPRQISSGRGRQFRSSRPPLPPELPPRVRLDARVQLGESPERMAASAIPRTAPASRPHSRREGHTSEAAPGRSQATRTGHRGRAAPTISRAEPHKGAGSRGEARGPGERGSSLRTGHGTQGRRERRIRGEARRRDGSSRRNRRGAPVRSGRKRRLLHGARRTRPRHARRRRQNHPVRRLQRRVATRRPDITTSFAAGRLSTSIAARQRGRRLGRRDRT